MNVNEIFTTIQGEGPRLGVPSLFIRLTGCNLYCIWCDTSYTWLFGNEKLQKVNSIYKELGSKVLLMSSHKREEENQKLTVQQLYEEVYDYLNYTNVRFNNIVITGGEPLLQLPEINEFLNRFDEDFTFEIETNGTRSANILWHSKNSQRIFFNVSPKLSNSFVKLGDRYKPSILDEFARIKNSIFKFVVTEDQDIIEVVRLVENHKIPQEKVFLMPEGRTRSRLAESSYKVVKLCKERGYRYTPRAHIELWGGERKK